MPKTPKSASSFRDTLTELEKLTAALEADDIDLDEAISHFETGSELASRLQEQLATAEQKIKKIKAQFAEPTEDEQL
jgi:exodeoxyribonuclease VII small subunit